MCFMQMSGQTEKAELIKLKSLNYIPIRTHICIWVLIAPIHIQTVYSLTARYLYYLTATENSNSTLF